ASMIKLSKVRWKTLFSVLFISGLAWFAYASQKADPLASRLEEVSVELFGASDAFSASGLGKGKQNGLFSPRGKSQEMPTVSILNNAAYTAAMVKIKDLKKMIEEESKKRANLPYESDQYQTLVEVAAKYVEIQRAIYLNFLFNVHELGIAPRTFNVDELNLRVDVGVGNQLLQMTELQKKFNIRHSADDPDLNHVDLFIPYYDRMQVEIAALSKLKNKVQYQKLIHLMHLRDSLVNRWSIKRISSGYSQEGYVTPPGIYATFSDDMLSKPSEYRFSKDLGVEDRYQVRVVDSVDRLLKVLEDKPIGSPAEYLKLVRRFYDSFEDFKGLTIDAEAVVANLYYAEETALQHSAKRIILDSSFPQDDLSSEKIGSRIAINAFKIRKAAILTTLIKRIKIDLATVQGYLEPDENGMIAESAIDNAVEFMKLPSSSLALVEREIAPFFEARGQIWRKNLANVVSADYAMALPGGENRAATNRFGEFFGRVLEGSGNGIFAVKQINSYESVKRKLESVSSTTAKTLDQKKVPLTTQCYSLGVAGAGVASCHSWVNSNRYLSRLDARSDAGMAWVTPWTPGQISSLLSKKLEVIEKYDADTWKKIKVLVEDAELMQIIGDFFENLNKRHNEAVKQKQNAYLKDIEKLSEKLAKEIRKNPDLDQKENAIYPKIIAVYNKIEKVGFLPEESVLTEEMYQAAAKDVFESFIKKVSVAPKIDPPAPPKPKKEDLLLYKPYVAVRDATYVAPAHVPDLEQAMLNQYMKRAERVASLGKLFSLLGFGEELFSVYRFDSRLKGAKGEGVPFVVIESLYAKPDAATIGKLNGAIKADARLGKAQAISEIARTALSQKLLSELIIADVYSRTPFLRIQQGEEDKAPTGLERLEKAYSQKNGWNRELAKGIFISLLKTAAENDIGKVEEGVLANPANPVQDESFRKIFRSQAYNRNVLISALSESKASWVQGWDDELKKETRTTSEKWSDGLNRVAGVLFVCTMVFLLWEFLPVIIPALGAAMPTASAFFSGFSILGMSGSVIAGFLSGSNLFVQMFFIATIAAQGQVAFFTLPAQLRYQKEIANSTVGLTAKTSRIVAPAERANRENIRLFQEEIRSAKIVTGVFAAIQVAFIPLQVKQIARGFGQSGKVALTRFGTSSPNLAASMRQYSLSELVQKFGYAKGSKMYFERYTTALMTNKPIRSVNGGATIAQANELLANSLSTHLSNSSEVAVLLERRIEFLKEKILLLSDQAKKQFAITQGKKVKEIDEAVRIFFGRELAAIGFRLQHPHVRIAVREKVAKAIEQGVFETIEFGTDKNLLKAFLLRMKAERHMYEAVFLKRQLEMLRNSELAAGGLTGTRELFLDFTRLEQVQVLDDLLKWGANHPEFQGSGFADLLAQARRASKDYKIIVNDIKNLTPKERAIYQAMNGESDVIVNDDLTLQLGSGSDGLDGVENFVVPGLPLGLRP
ncbi:MAG: hypothetical protein KGP28_00650, partial [Bdellovibrionales bacterium]|nr:hypothetical protein [Bdellovibrionales bacterium]